MWRISEGLKNEFESAMVNGKPAICVQVIEVPVYFFRWEQWRSRLAYAFVP